MKLTIPKVDIIRLWEAVDGTFGALKIGGFPFCVTLEPPDLLNVQNKSSIPGPQSYYCQKIISPKFGKTFEIMDVPKRSNVLFHPGNYVEETEACVLLGESWWKFDPAGERGIKNSGSTFKRFMEVMEEVSVFRLAITYSL